MSIHVRHTGRVHSLISVEVHELKKICYQQKKPYILFWETKITSADAWTRFYDNNKRVFGGILASLSD